MEAKHIVTSDGSFVYTEAIREGLLFHYYSDDDILEKFAGFELVHFETDKRGNRHLIVRMP